MSDGHNADVNRTVSVKVETDDMMKSEEEKNDETSNTNVDDRGVTDVPVLIREQVNGHDHVFIKEERTEHTGFHSEEGETRPYNSTEYMTQHQAQYVIPGNVADSVLQHRDTTNMQNAYTGMTHRSTVPSTSHRAIANIEPQMRGIEGTDTIIDPSYNLMGRSSANFVIPFMNPACTTVATGSNFGGHSYATPGGQSSNILQHRRYVASMIECYAPSAMRPYITPPSTANFLPPYVEPGHERRIPDLMLPNVLGENRVIVPKPPTAPFVPQPSFQPALQDPADRTLPVAPHVELPPKRRETSLESLSKQKRATLEPSSKPKQRTLEHVSKHKQTALEPSSKHKRPYKPRVGPDNGMYQCRKCPSRFKNYHTFRYHGIQIHGATSSFICCFCGKNMSSMGALKSHEERHNREIKYTCSVCGQGFVTSGTMENHYRVKHSDDGDCVCVVCSKKYSCLYYLNVHLRKVHRPLVITKQYQCTICKKSYSLKHYLTNHMEGHSKATVYECDLCKKTYFMKQSLFRHVYAHFHTPKKQFACSTCGKSFGNKSLLINHDRVHSGERPFACRLCDSKFATFSVLYRHMRSHGNAPVYECRVCGEGVKSKFEAQNHCGTS